MRPRYDDGCASARRIQYEDGTEPLAESSRGGRAARRARRRRRRARSARGRGRFFEPVRSPTPETFQGAFNFCRIMFSAGYDGDGGELVGRLSARRRQPVDPAVRAHQDAHQRPTRQGEPDHVVIALTDPALFECPFIMMTEVGNAYISPEEAAKLREYLQKGGFLWADDFWGSTPGRTGCGELDKVLPPNEYPIFELPKDHPLFRQQFQISKVTQIPSINFWMGSGGGTSERVRQRRAARDGRRRQQGPPDGADDAQHRLRRFMGARRRRPELLLQLLRRRLRLRHQRPALRDVALSHPDWVRRQPDLHGS